MLGYRGVRDRGRTAASQEPLHPDDRRHSRCVLDRRSYAGTDTRWNSAWRHKDGATSTFPLVRIPHPAQNRWAHRPIGDPTSISPSASAPRRRLRQSERLYRAIGGSSTTVYDVRARRPQTPMPANRSEAGGDDDNSSVRISVGGKCCTRMIADRDHHRRQECVRTEGLGTSRPLRVWTGSGTLSWGPWVRATNKDDHGLGGLTSRHQCAEAGGRGALEIARRTGAACSGAGPPNCPRPALPPQPD